MHCTALQHMTQMGGSILLHNNRLAVLTKHSALSRGARGDIHSTKVDNHWLRGVEHESLSLAWKGSTVHT